MVAGLDAIEHFHVVADVIADLDQLLPSNRAFSFVRRNERKETNRMKSKRENETTKRGRGRPMGSIVIILVFLLFVVFSLASFAYIQASTPDPLRTRQAFLNAAFLITPRWRLV